MSQPKVSQEKLTPELRARQIMEQHWPDYRNYSGTSIPTAYRMQQAMVYWWLNMVEFPEAEEFRQIYNDRMKGKILF